MRITGVQLHLASVELPVRHQVESGAGRKSARHAALLEVHTDEGVSGVGSCSFGSVSFELSFLAPLVEHVLTPVLRGRDPAAIERIWLDLYHGVMTRSYGRRGVAIALLSAVDVALWDLKGRALDVPVCNLLGGPVRQQVRCYASSVYWGSRQAAQRSAREYLDRGYRALKIKLGREPGSDIETLHAVRDEIGPSVDLMVDANLGYTFYDALRVGRACDRSGVLFFEEPLALDDVSGHAELARRLDTPIATGENLYTRWDFVAFIDAGVGVLQPDCTRSGGISEARRTADLAAARGRLVAPHTFSDPYSLAANLALCAAHESAFILEVDETFNPLMSHLVTRPLRPTRGLLDAPAGPGLGIELDRDWLSDHPYRGGAAVSCGTEPGHATLGAGR